MAKILDMPKLSPTMEEGQISLWHKKEGDEIAVDDLLAEVETDKATMEYRSFDKGTLLKILAPAGTVVKLGQPVAILGAPGEDVAALATQHGAPAEKRVAAPPKPPAPAPTPTPAPVAPVTPPLGAALDSRDRKGAAQALAGTTPPEETTSSTPVPAPPEPL